MDSKNVSVLVSFFFALSLSSCQTIKNDQMLTNSDDSHQFNQVIWKTNGQIFNLPDNTVLTSKESRIVLFQQSNDSDSDAITLSIGKDKAFQTSLRNGQYSDVIVCSGSEVISAGHLNKKSGKVLSHFENFQLAPQSTTYLQVALSATGKPVIRQIAADEALPLITQSTRQAHQISRVLSNCNASLESLQTLNTFKDDQKTEIKNPSKFNILFDFDSADINKHTTTLDGMANFIKSHPMKDITVEGHTDNKGSESYNMKLSQSRAKAVKNVLVDQYGIQSMRLKAVGFGETMPIDTNETKQGRQNNRRVVAVVTKESN